MAERQRPLIFVGNDDGYQAGGLKYLSDIAPFLKTYIKKGNNNSYDFVLDETWANGLERFR